MFDWTAAAPSMLASFMASMVEFVEALTIVLAVGVVRGWRSALLGAAAALALLVALVAVLGPALTRIPLQAVQLVVGTLLLLFGLRWLRKAVLRAAGVLALHDEARAFAEHTALLRRQGTAAASAIDTVAFGASFKIVMLEGIEVVFIVIAIGAGGTTLVPACIGAALALLAVVILGLWLHRPLAKMPENTLKFGVGVLLSAFGCFWVGEGIGIEWPGQDAVLPALVAAFLAVALALVAVCRRMRSPARGQTSSVTPKLTATTKSALATVSAELLGLFIDDGWLALGVLLWVALYWSAETRTSVPAATSTGALFTAGLVVVLCISAMRRARA